MSSALPLEYSPGHRNPRHEAQISIASIVDLRGSRNLLLVQCCQILVGETEHPRASAAHKEDDAMLIDLLAQQKVFADTISHL